MPLPSDTWINYIKLFPTSHQVVIQSLRITYQAQFDVFEFSDFERRFSQEGPSLFEELSHIPAATEFILSLSQWLKEKATGLTEWGLYPERFDGYERNFAIAIYNYYNKEKIPPEEFRNLPDLAVAKDIVFSLPLFNRDFWQFYIEILTNRYGVFKKQLRIIQQPQDVSGCPGDKVSFNVEVNVEEVSYQWKKNGENIEKATEKQYDLKLVAGDNHAEITVLVFSNEASILSEPARVTVKVPQILQQPQDVSTKMGDIARFSILVKGEGVTYQWRKEGVPLKGKTQPVLSLQNVHLKESGQYDCVVSTQCQSIVSRKAGLQVLDNYVVKGKIIKANRTPAINYTVKAYHHDQGKKYLLGQVRTNTNGNYLIPFTAEQFGLEWEGKANLSIEVTSQGINQKSPLVLGANKTQVINMITAQENVSGINEYEQLKEWFGENAPGFDWGNVREQDVETFSKRSGFPQSWVKAYSQANYITPSTDNTEGYYGLIRSKAGFAQKDFLNLKNQEARDALVLAQERNFISGSYDVEVFTDGLNTEFETEVGSLIQSGTDNDVNKFVGLVNFGGAPLATKRKFFELYKTNRDSAEKFWDAVDSQLSSYSESLKLVSQMGAVTSSNLDLMSELKNAHTFAKAQDLVKLTESDLETDIQNAGDPIPPYIQGDTLADKRKNYARWISGQIEEAYPTPYMQARIAEEANFPSQTDFGVFFGNNTAFELGKAPVHQYLSDNPDALSGISDPEAFTKDLLKLQRFHTIAPREQKARTATALFNKNYESAPQIAKTPFKAFVSELSPEIGERAASQVYASAREVTARAVNFAGKYNQGLNSAEFQVVRGNRLDTYSPELRDIFPDIEALLGETDYCACEHCKSIFGPAAYLVDLLKFCQDINTEELSLYDILTKTYGGLPQPRRGDMPNIDLNCDNTNTTLPAIDIVNELLCDLTHGSFPDSRQTTWTAEELRIAPEYPPTDEINALLSDTKFPWGLPFDYFSRSIGLQLPIAKTSRGEIAWYLPKASLSSETLQNIRTAGVLVISKTTWLRLKMDPFNLNTIYGIASGSVESNFEDGAGRLLLKKFIDHIGLSFGHFKKLLETATLNPYQANGDRKYSISYTGEGCSLETARIAGIQNFYQRLYYLEKLSSSLNWELSLADLYVRGFDLLTAIDAHNSARLTDALNRAGLLKRLSQKLETDFASVFPWFSVLNTTTYEEGDLTQFETIYLNPEVSYAYTDTEKSGLVLNGKRSEIASPQSLGAMKNTILASLQIDESALDSLVKNSDWLGGSGYSLDATLPRLAQLYGYVELAGALDLEIAEMVLLWKGFTNGTEIPLGNTYADIERLIAFADFIHQLKTSTFNSEELGYLFTFKDLEKILPVAGTTTWLNQLRAMLNKQWEETSILKNTQRGIHFLLETQTVAPVSDTDLKNMDRIINGKYSDTEQTALVDWWENDFQLADETNIHTIRPEFAEKVIVIDTTPQSIYKEDKNDRINYIFESFHEANLVSGTPFINNVFTTYLNQFALQEFVSHFLGDFPMVSPLQDSLLTNTDYLQDPDNAEIPLLNVFTDKGFVENMEQPIDSKVYEAYRLLFKNLLFLSKFEHIDQYYPLFYNEHPENWPEPATFPVTNVPGIPMKGLQKVWGLKAVEKSLSLEKSELFLMLMQAREGVFADAGEAEQRLSTLTEWPLSEIQALGGTDGFNFTGNYYLQSDWIYILYHAFEVSEKLGANPTVVQDWNKMAHTKTDASAIQQAVRKQLKGDTGTDKLIEVNDTLREALRDALVEYVVYQTNVLDGTLFEKSRAGMSDFLLTDIQKSACGTTSRIKQALSAIQMLMQRALLGLERLPGTPPTFEIPAGPVKEWVWRKNYRVWEANRKVFMYPENWLLNETRDDQTELYRDFVEELSQSNITDKSARRAATHYLQGLSEIANLEIAQIYQEEEEQSGIATARRRYLTGTVHIFARTKGTPHTYYYRKWVDDAYFTPWEKLPFEIEGDHLIPTMYAGRLWLFWPIFIEKGDENAPVDTDIPGNTNNGGTFSSTPPPPKKYYEIRMAWTTAFCGQWQPKKLTKEPFSTKKFQFIEKSKYYFYTAINNDDDLILTPIFYTPISNSETGEGSNTAHKLNQFMRFSGSDSQPELLLTESELPKEYLLPDGNPFYMHNKFGQNEPIPRFSSGPFQDDPAANRLITSTTSSLATVPQQFPTSSIRSDYAFFFEDRSRVFLANPEVYPLSRAAVSFSTMEATGALLDRAMQSDTGNLQPRTAGEPIPDTPSGIIFGGTTENSTIILGKYLPELTIVIDGPEPGGSSTPLLPSHRFYAHYHPFASDFYKEVNRYGLEGIYEPVQENLKRQLAETDFDFNSVYDPSTGVIPKYPIEDIDFTSFGAYSVYNWELFLHIPLTVAQMLTSNYRFAEAQQWLHHIFDPTESEGKTPERFWKIKPLYEFSSADTAEELRDFVEGNDENLQKLIKLWEKNPFNPHLIARFRISTYMRRVIMVYIENLIAWADQLFTQDSIESINEAFQLYMLAWRILGERPQKLPPREQNVKSIAELIGGAPSWTGVLVQLSDGLTTHLINTAVSFNSQEWSPRTPQLSPLPVMSDAISRGPKPVPAAQSENSEELQTTLNGPNRFVAGTMLSEADNRLFAVRRTARERYNPAADQFSQAAEAMNTLGYFCVLPNTQMYEYWDTVEDRLYKLRNCLNIQGEERSLALFEPPIDPGAIIAALASGQSLSSAINGLTAPLPYYRFRYLIGRALGLVQEVKGLGQSMLSALEKADAEELSLLREQHQENVLDAVRQVKIKAVEEAEASLRALQAQRENVKYREQFYRSRKYTISEEDNYIKGMQTANTLTTTAAGITVVTSVLAAIPNFSLGVNGAFGSPHAASSASGYNFSAATKAASQALEFAAGIARNKAGIENTKGSWVRRENNWIFQAEAAKKELKQVDELIAAASIRIEMAQRDLQAHDRQIANAVQTQQVIDTQFSNRDLYMWMRSELSSLYRSAYNEALTLAKQTEQCFRFELWDSEGPTTTTHITSDHWDGLKKGLLSGEKLERQLRSMQSSYDDQNERLFELKKNISLSEIDPGALLKLKRTGKTAFSISEFLFDLDYAGQYQRRIKSVAITIPCVAGPYGNITARLSLTGNLVRKDATLIDGEYKKQSDDTRFRDGISPSQALATTIGTSSANRDSGLFELNFNDERYLPFEGAGVISDWVLELPNVYQESGSTSELILKQFDYDSISDVILHIDYTARENTGTFKNTVKTYLRDNLNAGIEGGWNELISLKAQFSDAFYKFLNPALDQTNMETEFVITNKQFPYIFNGLDTEITEMTLLIRLKEGVDVAGNAVNMRLGKTDNLPGFQTMEYGENSEDKTYHLLYCSFDYSAPITGKEKSLTLRKTSDVTELVTAGKVEDIMLLVSFGEV